MLDFKKSVAEILDLKIADLNENEIAEMIEIPPNSDMGDYAFPCFRLAKIFRKAPNMIAADLATEIGQVKGFSKVESAGGYVNFFVDNTAFAKNILNEVFYKKSKYGSSSIGKDKTVIVEYSSPNIAKPFHIGHIRTTVIGHALKNIYDFLGYDTVSINHLGDYGTQFGKLIVAYKAWGVESEVEKNPIPALLKLYIKFHEEAEEKPELEDEARAWFKKLEDGDAEAKRLWQWFRDVSLKEFKRVYDMFGIEFDSYAGESFYSDKMPAVIEEMQQKNLLEESKGADIINLEEFNMPPALIRKSDGSTLYITRDIAAAIYRKSHYDFYKNIYVVGSQQNLHFNQWFKVIELMGHDWAKDCIHVPFGMVALEEGTMSTRKGRVVFLEDVLKKAVDRTAEIMEEKKSRIDDFDEVAKAVGIGAVMFQELSNNRIKDYTFSWDRTLNFEGETGPYVQYTHARACSVIRKANVDISENVDCSLLDGAAITVLKTIEMFPQIVKEAARKNEPSIVTRYIVDVAQDFNKFYNETPILVDDEEVKKSRLAVVYAVKETIKNGLGLLGIKAPQKM